MISPKGLFGGSDAYWPPKVSPLFLKAHSTCLSKDASKAKRRVGHWLSHWNEGSENDEISSCTSWLCLVRGRPVKKDWTVEERTTIFFLILRQCKTCLSCRPFFFYMRERCNQAFLCSEPPLPLTIFLVCQMRIGPCELHFPIPRTCKNSTI